MEENVQTANNGANNQNDKKGIGYYFGLGEVLTYYFRKKDPNRPRNINLKMMHGINKISILLFLFALIVWIIRRVF